MRNPIININGFGIKLIGDSHLGREFKNFVPLSRRGEREASVWNQFKQELKPIGGRTGDFTVHMGDLFDKSEVPFRLLLDTAEVLNEAGEDRRTIVIAGNHDRSRDKWKASALEVLSKLVSPMVTIVFEPFIHQGRFGFFPYTPFQTAAELVSEYIEKWNLDKKLDAVFGHWDAESYGKQSDNLIPLQELSKITDTVYTGHIHLPGRFTAYGVDVNIVGSMQPFGFVEDGKSELYVTVTKPELENRLLEDPTQFKNKCLRVVMQPNEELPDVDCLQLKPKITGEQDEETIDTTVEFETFKFEDLFTEAFFKVDPEITKEVWNQYQTIKTNEEDL